MYRTGGEPESVIDIFRQRARIWIMIITVGIIYRILYEYSIDTGEETNNSGLHFSASTAIDFYPVQVVKHGILQ